MLGDSMMGRTLPQVVRQLEAVLPEQGVCKLAQGPDAARQAVYSG